MRYQRAIIIFVLGLYGCNEEPQQNDSESFKEQRNIDKPVNETDITHDIGNN